MKGLSVKHVWIAACAALVLAARAALGAVPAFGPAQPLNATAFVDVSDDFAPRLATDGAGSWVAVWASNNPLSGSVGSDFDIFVARSTDNGATWSVPSPLNTNASTDSGNDLRPRLATDGAGTWIVVWYSFDTLGGTIGSDADVLFARSTNNGVTWSQPAAIHSNAAGDSGTDQDPELATDGAGTWIVAWSSDESLGGALLGADSDILMVRSTTGGASWTAPTSLNTLSGSDSREDLRPDLATDGTGRWVAAWESFNASGDSLGTDTDLFVARSSDNGATWLSPVALNSNAASDSGNDLVPTVVTDGAGTWLTVWQSSDTLGGTVGTDFDVFFTRSVDEGASWTSAAVLNSNAATDSGGDNSPDVTVDGSGNWLVAWDSFEPISTTGADADILMASSTDAAVWVAPTALNSTASGDSGGDFFPSLANDGSGTWMAVWQSHDSFGGTVGNDGDIFVAVGSFCGNGAIDPGEQCDDGNRSDGDCCSSTCTVEPDGSVCDDELFCTAGDVCSAGVCSGGARDCSAAGDECNDGVCNEDADACEPSPVNEGGSCDDGLFCTVGDVCSAGTCSGGARDCSAAGDQCNDGICNEGTDACEATPVNEGGSCDDGLFCTIGDTCSAGVCAGGARDCSAAGDECNNGVCNEAANACEPSPVADGMACADDGNVCTNDLCQAGSCTHPDNTASCDDGLFCTTGDLCSAGVCSGASSRDCSAAGDQCNDGICNESADACQPSPANEGGSCDDGLFCTVDDVCATGVCLGGTRDCSAAGDECNDGVCNESADTCQPSPVDDGTACSDDGNLCTDDLCQAGSCAHPDNTASCDDGLFCTTGDLCSGGTCAGGARDCSAAGDECNDGICNETADACQPSPMDDGTACSDDGNVCTNDLCQAGACAHPDNTASCDDGLFCTTGDVCSAGVCSGASPRDCSAAGDQCNDGICNETADACQPSPVDDGAACSDDGNVCTDDLCQAGACAHPDNTAPCDDGLFCTTGDVCSEGACSGAARDCSAAGDECNNGACNETADACQPSPVDDGTACSDDGNICTDDVCQAGACAHPDNTAPCDDGLFCTTGDVCAAGACSAGAPRDCSAASDECNDGVCNETADACEPSPVDDGTGCSDDGNVCTDDLCQAGSCAHPDNTAPCDDGLFCTTGDVCSAGVCSGASPRDCSAAGDQCNDGACNETADACQPSPANEDASCDDGLFCTIGDVCTAGTCSGSARDCSASGDECNNGACNEGTDACEPSPMADGTACSDDGNICTDDVCQTGSCSHPDNTASCDDGLFCTTGDVCAAGACSAGAPRDCSAAGDECNDGVCNETADSCEPSPVADGKACSDDGNVCTNDLCQAGSCAHPNNTAACDDGLFCTVDDVCAAGACSGSARDCSAAADECNGGACNETADACQPSSPLPDGTACSDDSNVCTDDLCQAGSCAHPNNTAACDDGLFCTVDDACAAGACSGAARDCSAAGDQCNDGACNETADACEPSPVDDGTACSDDGNICTDDLCQAGSCAHPDNTAPCDDGLFCTVGNVCSAGVCSGGSSRDCSAAGNQCNDGVCNEAKDLCEMQPADEGRSCDDGNACTRVDSCEFGICVGRGPIICRAIDQCHEAGTCDQDTGLCSDPVLPDGTACDDQDACTEAGTCVKGVCDRPFVSVCGPAEGCCISGCSPEEDPDCPAVCGDGALDGGEECDDGRKNSDVHPQTCRSDCTLPDLCGDADQNRVLSLTDALRITRFAVGLEEECPLTVCDANGDGKVTIIDGLRVLETLVGLPTELNCNLRIVFFLEESRLLGGLTFEVDYSETASFFVGKGPKVDCTTLAVGAVGSFNNEPGTRTLTVSLASADGFQGPTRIAECRYFDRTTTPRKKRFNISVTEVIGPDQVPVAEPRIRLRY